MFRTQGEIGRSFDETYAGTASNGVLDLLFTAINVDFIFLTTTSSIFDLMLVANRHERIKGFKRNRWRWQEATEFLNHCCG